MLVGPGLYLRIRRYPPPSLGIMWFTFSFQRKIHIMGSFQNIKIARDAIVSLILGSPPGKVYAGLRTVSSRMRQRAL